MRLPSIDELRRHAAAAFRRFPWTIGAGVASALVVIAGAEDIADVLGVLTRSGEGTDLLVATTLALPLFFALRLAQERGIFTAPVATVLRLLGVAALGAVVWFWPEWSDKTKFLRYAQLSLGFHLLAAALPFARGGELNGFWQYNRSLFLRFLLGALYAGVLYAGLAVALLAIENLFGVDFPGEPYMDLLALVGFGFQTWFFTAGVPEDLTALEAAHDYPRGLKLFSQYVLIPLVTVYLAILTAYLAKVLITTEWPSGWIGWLVSCVSVAGILSILLTHPIRDRSENQWIVTYGRWFWLVMLPAIGMLVAAVWKRIDQYGITEPRYFLLVLALWLAAMAVVYGLVRSQNIKWLPASLAVLAFVTFLGPWGAYAVSRSSQLSRLEGLLERNGLLEDGRATPLGAAAEARGDTVPAEDRRQIGAALTYLFAHHGAGPLAGLLGPELAVSDSLGGTDPVREWLARDRAADVMAALDLEFVEPRLGLEGPSGHFHVRIDPGEAVDIGGYEYAFEAGRNSSVRLAGRAFQVEVDAGLEAVVLRGDGVTFLTVPLREAIERGLEYARSPAAGPDAMIPREIMRVEVEQAGIAAAFVPTWISGRRVGDRLEVDAVSGTWLLNIEEGALEAPPDTADAPDGPEDAAVDSLSPPAGG